MINLLKVIIIYVIILTLSACGVQEIITTITEKSEVEVHYTEIDNENSTQVQVNNFFDILYYYFEKTQTDFKDEIENSGNDNLADCENKASENIYLVDILEPYQANDYEAFVNGVSVMMGGMKRYNGFTLDTYGWNGQSCAIYNLNGEYSELSGMIGYIDGRTGDGDTWDVHIYTDDTLIYTCTVSPGDLPQEFSIDLNGVSKLEFRAGATNGRSGHIGFAELELN